jgi:hypothetical protein
MRAALFTWGIALAALRPAWALDPPPDVAAREAALEQAWHRQAQAWAPEEWVRPVLRGDPVDGNAAEALAQALVDAAPVLEAARRDRPDLYFAPRPEGSAPEVRALATRVRPIFESARRTRVRWPATPVDQCLFMRQDRLDDDLTLGRAAKVVLAAAGTDAGACLAAAADVIRTAQDSMAGRALTHRVAAGMVIGLACDRAQRCAALATAAERARAADAFARLVREWPPIGPTLRFERLFSASGHLTALRSSRGDPSFVPGVTFVVGLTSAAHFLAVAERGAPEDGRPAAWVDTADPRDFGLLRYASGEAEVRAMVGLLAVELAGNGPPADVLDPFTGAPYQRRTREDGTRSLWSVGADGRSAPDEPDRGDDVWVDLTPNGLPAAWSRTGRTQEATQGMIGLSASVYRLGALVGIDTAACEPLPDR